MEVGTCGILRLARLPSVIVLHIKRPGVTREHAHWQRASAVMGRNVSTHYCVQTSRSQYKPTCRRFCTLVADLRCVHANADPYVFMSCVCGCACLCLYMSLCMPACGIACMQCSVRGTRQALARIDTWIASTFAQGISVRSHVISLKSHDSLYIHTASLNLPRLRWSTHCGEPVCMLTLACNIASQISIAGSMRCHHALNNRCSKLSCAAMPKHSPSCMGPLRRTPQRPHVCIRSVACCVNANSCKRCECCSSVDHLRSSCSDCAYVHSFIFVY